MSGISFFHDVDATMPCVRREEKEGNSCGGVGPTGSMARRVSVGTAGKKMKIKIDLPRLSGDLSRGREQRWQLEPKMPIPSGPSHMEGKEDGESIPHEQRGRNEDGVAVRAARHGSAKRKTAVLSATTEDDQGTVGLRDTLGSGWSAFFLIFVAPTLNMLCMGGIYMWAPLRTLELQKEGNSFVDLSVLGVVLVISNLTRGVLLYIYMKFGHWCWGIWGLFATAMAMKSAMLPRGDPYDFLLTVFTCCSANAMMCLQGLIYSHFASGSPRSKHSVEAIRVAALRHFTVFETISYSVSSLIFGALYEFGGYDLCLYTYAGLIGANTLGFIFCPAVMQEARRSLLRIAARKQDSEKSSGDKNRQPPYDVPSEAGGVTKPSEVAVISNSTGKIPSHAGDIGSSVSTRSELLGSHSLRTYFLFLMLVHTTSVLSYGVEWTLYSVYFREVYDWESPFLTGLAQMAGDILASFLLLCAPTISRFARKGTESRRLFSRIFVAVKSSPTSSYLLLFSIMVSDATMLHPPFPCSHSNSFL